VLVKGRWNPAERELLKANIAKYGEIHNIPDVREWLSQRKGKQGGSAQSFFLEVSDGLGRPVASVYREIHRMFNNQGKGKVYTEADVKKLCELQKQHGNNWIEIGKQMDRTAESVRDRWAGWRCLAWGQQDGGWRGSFFLGHESFVLMAPVNLAAPRVRLASFSSSDSSCAAAPAASGRRRRRRS